MLPHNCFRFFQFSFDVRSAVAPETVGPRAVGVYSAELNSFLIFLQGKLLYSTAPPEEDETVFQQMGYKLQKLNDLEIKQLKGKDKSAKQVGVTPQIEAHNLIAFFL